MDGAAEYICPKCGHFNPSARSQRSRATSPLSPVSALPPAGAPAGLHQAHAHANSHALVPALGVPVGVVPPVQKPGTPEKAPGDEGEKSMSMEVDS